MDEYVKRDVYLNRLIVRRDKKQNLIMYSSMKSRK